MKDVVLNIRRYGLAGVFSYGLLNFMYYSTATTVGDGRYTSAQESGQPWVGRHSTHGALVFVHHALLRIMGNPTGFVLKALYSKQYGHSGPVRRPEGPPMW